MLNGGRLEINYHTIDPNNHIIEAKTQVPDSLFIDGNTVAGVYQVSAPVRRFADKLSVLLRKSALIYVSKGHIFYRPSERVSI